MDSLALPKNQAASDPTSVHKVFYLTKTAQQDTFEPFPLAPPFKDNCFKVLQLQLPLVIHATANLTTIRIE
ncbi:hypothetical protein WH50_16360 [Pokkaliibacter plantistimulans]|uniref:Uncharacterized protein n=1 Tax=Pokkaliibacter plantistimulans TaxID=1635171 RepID=A0ABX5LUA4_9GAMM|nr:hypothetical protein WH50_16360 [Pokkaliibacter plantistimulans]